MSSDHITTSLSDEMKDEIRKKRPELRALAESDYPASPIAAALLDSIE